MPVPDAVRAAVQQADETWEAMYGGEAKVVNAPDPLAGLENVPDPAPAPAEPKAQEEPAPQDPAPSPTPAPAEPPKPAEPDPWEQRYKVLKGKYDAEVPRLQQDLNQSRNALEALTRQVEELQQQVKQRERESALKLTPEEETAFGKDLIDLTRKVAAAEAEARARELEARLEKTQASVQTVAKTAEQSAQERFLQAVDTSVPDWREVDQRPDWLEWLGQHDPLLGSVRQAVLDQATKARDASRVAALFNAFKATLPAPAPAAAAQGPDTVQQQVAPRSQQATPAQPSAQKRLYTEADLQALYSANRRGEFKREEWAQISAEIDLAVAEGRVR